MFLDDELLEICRAADCSTTENIQQLNKDLYNKCCDYYRVRISPTMSNKNIKIELDRTFNLWDSFTRTAIKEGGYMAILGVLFQKFTFKGQFLKHKEISEIYNSL
jgi:hypothetical protein